MNQLDNKSILNSDSTFVCFAGDTMDRPTYITNDLRFNPVLNVCDWSDRAGCAGGNATDSIRTTTESMEARKLSRPQSQQKTAETSKMEEL